MFAAATTAKRVEGEEGHSLQAQVADGLMQGEQVDGAEDEVAVVVLLLAVSLAVGGGLTIHL